MPPGFQVPEPRGKSLDHYPQDWKIKGALKQIGYTQVHETRWAASKDDEGADYCHYESILHHF